MNLPPSLDSLSNFRVLLFELFGKLMHFSKEFAPCMNDCLVMHPFEIRKRKLFSIDPGYNDN